MSAPFQARLFGPLEVLIDGVPMQKLRSRKGQVLLAHLILRNGSEVAREYLCELLWPDSLLDQARLSLRQSLVDLRKALGTQGYRIDSPETQSLRFLLEGSEVDVVRFDRLSAGCEFSRANLEELLKLFRGPMLEGVDDEPIRVENEARKLAFSRYLIQYIESATASEEWSEVIYCCKSAIIHFPLTESYHRSLMTTLSSAGNHAEALDVYGRLKSQLWAQKRIEPDPTTVQTFREIRDAAQSKHQAISHQDQELARSNVPRPLNRLIGRTSENASIVNALHSHRLVSITGPGGIGKTRLTLEVCYNLEKSDQFPDGIAFVPLADCASPQFVPELIARSVGLRDDAKFPTMNALRRFLSHKKMLVVLDNCEHLIDACSLAISELLSACPELCILATTREVLGVVGELNIAVSPLELSPAEASVQEIRDSEAFLLFEDRRALLSQSPVLGSSEVILVGEICRRLDGIPLAIELAAARLRVLSLEDILKRTESRFVLLKSSDRDRPARHQTMEDSIQESYRLLRSNEQLCFCELCIFEGGFTLEAADAVCTEGNTLAHITRLIESSLLSIGPSSQKPTRYYMLETIRQFGLLQLQETGFGPHVSDRHYQEFLRLSRESRTMLLGSEQLYWLQRMDAEQPNIRAALARCSSNQEFAQLVETLMFYWHLSGNAVEAKRWFSEALTRTEGVAKRELARVYLGAGMMAWHIMNLQNARSWLERGAEYALEISDEMTLASSYSMLGIILRTQGESEKAYEVSKESVRLMRDKNDPARLARSLANFGRAASSARRLTEAVEIFEESLGLFKQVGDTRDFAHTMQSLAWNLTEQGDFARSKQLHRESIETLYELRDAYRLAWSFSNLSSVCFREGRILESAKLYAIVLALEKSGNYEVLIPGNEQSDLEISTFHSTLGHTEMQRLISECESLSLDSSVEFALTCCA